METQRKLVHTGLIPIRWGDMDAYGHVNNTVFFRFMEQCRVEYLEKLGYKAKPLMGDSQTFVTGFRTTGDHRFQPGITGGMI